MVSTLQSRLRDKGSRRTPMALGVFLVCTLVVILQARWVANNKERFRGTLDESLAAPNGARFVACGVCGRSGRVARPGSENGDLMCPVCFGIGGHYVLIDDPALEKTCPTCGGAGRLLNPDRVTAETCFLCEGRGIARIPPGYMVCPECRGRGGIAGPGGVDPCWLCDERGFIMQDLSQFPPPDE